MASIACERGFMWKISGSKMPSSSRCRAHILVRQLIFGGRTNATWCTKCYWASLDLRRLLSTLYLSFRHIET